MYQGGGTQAATSLFCMGVLYGETCIIFKQPKRVYSIIHVLLLHVKRFNVRIIISNVCESGIARLYPQLPSCTLSFYRPVMLISSRTASKISDNGMVQRGSLAPWSAFWPSPFNSQQPMDRALGVAATLALSLALLRLAGHALRYDGQEEAPSSFSSIKGLLRTILLDLYPSRQAEGQDQEWIVHRGSCHCKAIQFEVRIKE